MENPQDYDIDKDMGDTQIDEDKIGEKLNFIINLRYFFITSTQK